MFKQEFLDRLRQGLDRLPREDVEERLAFYNDMIDDRMEEGYTEEEAVSAIGAAESIVSQILEEMPPAKQETEKKSPKRQLSAWEIVLLVLGSPVWLSLLIAVLAVVFSLYVSLWSVILSLWAVFATLAGCGFGGIVSGAGFAYSGNMPAGIAMIGAGLVCAGFSVFLFFGCTAATKGTLLLTKKLLIYMKNRIIKKEVA